jgi:CMP/dCMP kinase
VGEQRLVIAISRQLGSGGSVVGREVARRLNLRYADRDILQRAAETLGIAEEDAEAYEERVQSVWERLAPLFWVPLPGGPTLPGVTLATGSALYDAESSIIEALASREDVVVVGRGGGHLLKDRPGVTWVFIHAAEAFRIDQVATTIGGDAEAALDMIRRSDRERSAFHRAIAQRDWCDARQYHLCFDTSVLGIAGVTEALIDIVSARRRIAP